VGALIALWRRSRDNFINLFPVSAADSTKAIIQYALEWGLLGAINGALFAMVLAFAERRRSVAALSLSRIGAWGAIATVVIPIVALFILLFLFPPKHLSVEVVPLVGIVSLGAMCGVGMLLIARRKGA
jgi:hypothetical protein